MHRFGTYRFMRRQRGVTALGWLFLLIPVAVVFYAGIRLTPVYLNYMRVARSLDQTASTLGDGTPVNQQAIFTTLNRHWEVEGIDFPAVKDITIQRDGTSWVIEAKYEDTAALFANLSLLIDFDKVAHLHSGGG